MVIIIATILVGHVPIVLSFLEKPIPFVAQCAGFEGDQPNSWYGLVMASIVIVSMVITACYTFKLKGILKKSVKNRYSHQIPDNMMKIGNALMSRHLDYSFSSRKLHSFGPYLLAMCYLWRLLHSLPVGLWVQKTTS